MGCRLGSATQTVVAVEESRKRLSISELDEVEDEGEVEVTEDDRSLLMQLSQQQLFDFFQTDEKKGGRRFSVGSQTDKNLNDAHSFSEKTKQMDGETFNAEEEGIGWACKKGLKPESPNQDSFLIMKVENQYALYGVFDGHGRKGHDVSNFVKDNLPKILFSQKEFREDPETALKQTFAKTQYLLEKATSLKTIDAWRSGSTCSIVLHCIKTGIIYVAHVGDSRVVLGKKAEAQDDIPGEDALWEAVDLTIDHKPDTPEERQRIEAAGGMVVFDGGWNYRIFAKNKKDARGKRYPGLNMSRAMGDLSGYHDAGISCEPDIHKLVLSSHAGPGVANAISIKSDLLDDDEKRRSGTDESSTSTKAPSDGTINFTPVQPGGPTQDGTAVPGSVREDSVTEGSALKKSSPGGATITKHDRCSQDQFLLVCSDGVWEFIKSEEAVAEVATFAKKDAPAAAEHLCALAWKQWCLHMEGQVVDDITCVLIHLGG